MIRTPGIEHQTIIRIGSIYPCPYQAGNIHRQHAVILIGNEIEVGSAAIKITAQQSPAQPCNRVFIPIGSDTIKGCGLTSLTIQRVEIECGTGDSGVRGNGT